MDSLEDWTGTRESEIVYHEGTFSETEPSCGIIDLTLKATLRTALGTASFSEELVKSMLLYIMTCCWKAEIDVRDSTTGFARSQPS